MAREKAKKRLLPRHPIRRGFRSEISTGIRKSEICFRGGIFFGFNFAHDFEISAIKPPHRRERNARTVSEEVGT